MKFISHQDGREPLLIQILYLYINCFISVLYQITSTVSEFLWNLTSDIWCSAVNKRDLETNVAVRCSCQENQTNKQKLPVRDEAQRTGNQLTNRGMKTNTDVNSENVPAWNRTDCPQICLSQRNTALYREETLAAQFCTNSAICQVCVCVCESVRQQHTTTGGMSQQRYSCCSGSANTSATVRLCCSSAKIKPSCVDLLRAHMVAAWTHN